MLSEKDGENVLEDVGETYSLKVCLQGETLFLCLKTYDFYEKRVKMCEISFSNSEKSELLSYLFDDMETIFREVFKPKINYKITSDDQITLFYQIRFACKSYLKSCAIKLQETFLTKQEQLSQIIAKQQSLFFQKKLIIRLEPCLKSFSGGKANLLWNQFLPRFNFQGNSLELKSQSMCTTAYFDLYSNNLWSNIEVTVRNINTNEYLQTGICSKEYSQKVQSLSKVYKNNIEFSESGQIKYQYNDKRLKLNQEKCVKEIKIVVKENKWNQKISQIYAQGVLVFSCNIKSIIESHEIAFYVTLGGGGDSAEIQICST